jgi:hypothetical protein
LTTPAFPHYDLWSNDSPFKQMTVSICFGAFMQAPDHSGIPAYMKSDVRGLIQSFHSDHSGIPALHWMMDEQKTICDIRHPRINKN